jgi:hypothetical protein
VNPSPLFAQQSHVEPEVFLTGYVQEDIDLIVSPDERDMVSLYRMLDASRKVSAQKWMERQAKTVNLEG